MSVRLIEYPDNARELLAYACACYLNKADTDNFDRVLAVMARKEDSVLEFASATFEFETSLVVRDHLFRYRLASMAAGGLRYNEPQAFITPPEVEDPQLRERLLAFYAEAHALYTGLRADKVAKGAARYLLPCGVEVRYLMRFNFRHLAKEVLPQRLWAPGVQRETRQTVQELFDSLLDKDPVFWQAVQEHYCL